MAVDYSIYSLRQLFKERYWIDPDGDETRAEALEAEIQKRCAEIRGRVFLSSSAAEKSGRFEPYGLIASVVLLLFSVGPFAVVKFLDTIAVIHDTDGERAILSGIWTLLTLPALAMVFTIGGMMDAERIVKWFNLAGAQAQRKSRQHRPANSEAEIAGIR